MIPLRNRQLLQFRLTKWFLLIAIVSAFFAYQGHLIRQRHAELRRGQIDGWYTGKPSAVRAPGILPYFGEQGYEVIFVQRKRNAHPVEERRQLDRIQKLFPEAKVVWGGYEPATDERVPFYF